MGPGNSGNAPPPADLNKLRRELHEAAEPERVPELQRFFKTGPGGYGEGDVFLGVRVPAVRFVARRHAGLNLEDVTMLLRCPIHEERLAALVILVRRYGRADEQQRQRIYDLYLENTAHVNSWDLVDVSAPHIVGAHLSGTLDRLTNEELAARLAERFTVSNYYRRGHGESEDTASYAVLREVEDLEAIINEAGGSASVFGSSGNGKFALEAAASGLAARIEKVAVWEPPYIVDDSRPPVPADYEKRLTELRSAGRSAEMIELYLTEAVGMPAQAVAPMRNTPYFAAFEAVAHTLVHDAKIAGDFSLPTERMACVTVPTLVIYGGEAAWPWVRKHSWTLFRMPGSAHLKANPTTWTLRPSFPCWSSSSGARLLEPGRRSSPRRCGH